ncbi:replication initiation protein [Clostridium sporogenes]
MYTDNKLIIKSNYIVEASYKLSLAEQRIIYVLTSMINQNDKEFKTYRLTVKEFVEILGTKNKDMYSRVANYVEGLRERDLTIIKEKSILKTKWLSSAEYFIDDGYVELCFDPKLKPYLLMLKERFTKLSLQQMVSFKSQYSGRIYELLKQYQNIGQRIFEINELKELLGISFDKYNQYGLFKQRILSKAKKEINSDSDLIIEFEEIKTGRKVTSIKFYIKCNKKNNVKEEICATLEDSNYIDRVKSIFHEEISNLQAKQIFDTAKGNIDLIKEKYQIAKQTNNINNLVGWIIDALKKDYKEPIGKTKVDKFNDFEQRQYDFEDLEKKLLG